MGRSQQVLAAAIATQLVGVDGASNVVDEIGTHRFRTIQASPKDLPGPPQQTDAAVE